ncbi:MAG: hypothetical protein JJU02_06875 [Cryomorphaceae bacterium]|nr:hypothetical protein [Cryomorphaceae bacterium]
MKEEIILSESGDSLLVVYWENGSRKQETKLKSGKKNGEEKYYDQAGSLRAKGEVINGLKSGIWEFFDAHGYLESIYEFKIIDAKSEANRYWKIGENGDTIIDESNFYEASFIFDTIAFGDFTALNIRLTKPFFGDEVGLLIGDFNEDFSNESALKSPFLPKSSLSVDF